MGDKAAAMVCQPERLAELRRRCGESLDVCSACDFLQVWPDQVTTTKAARLCKRHRSEHL